MTGGVISSIREAEPIGPKKLLDLLIIAPCTGNTLGKLACGITDTTVTMAAKAHLRNQRPLLIAPSTNDGLTASAPNLAPCWAASTSTLSPSAKTTRKRSLPPWWPIFPWWPTPRRQLWRGGSFSLCCGWFRQKNSPAWAGEFLYFIKLRGPSA